MDIGLLLLRVVVGLLLVGHGTQKLFGWFGGHGLDGTGGFLESLGYRPGRPHAILAGAAEAAGGLCLTLGLLTPLAGAVVIGVMVNAIVAVHLPSGVWNQDGGLEYPLVLSTIGATLAFTGPGDASVDAALGTAMTGIGYGIGAALLGLVAGLLLLSLRTAEEVVEVAGEGEVSTFEPVWQQGEVTDSP